MELQLGLALPTNPIKNFDLNNHVYEPEEKTGLKKWSTADFGLGSYKKDSKRSFNEAFEKIKPVTQTLPLLLWNDQPNDEDDDRKNLKKWHYSYTINKDEGENNYVIGWPPIKTWRRKLLYQHQGGPLTLPPLLVENNQREEEEIVENGTGGLNSMYVKVKMEGVPIGRKVDLSLHYSYQTLTNTLIDMFGKYQKTVKGPKNGATGTRYTLTYQDRKGDWLSVGDVPWQTFIRSVARLKLVRNGD